MFVVLAFYRTQDFRVIASLSVSIYLLKVAIEIAATPLVYQITGFLKRTEGEDYFDVGTNFNPFALFGKRAEEPQSPKPYNGPGS